MKPLTLQQRRLLAPRAGGAFTLVELLVVIGIIALLVGILIPVVGRVRAASRNAAAQAQVAALKSAVDRYYADFKAYPGPISNQHIYNSTIPGTDPNQVNDFASGNPMSASITMSENLVLGLLGGLQRVDPVTVVYDWNLVGRGPMSLNTANPKRYEPMAEATSLSWTDNQPDDKPNGAGAVSGYFADLASPIRDTGAFDSVIPEFVDPYPNPMPILYFRANRGAPGVISDARNVLSAGVPVGPFQYDIGQNYAYLERDGSGFYIGTDKSIGVGDYSANFNPPPAAGKFPHGISTINDGRSLDKGSPEYQYPYDALPYFSSPSATPTDISTPNDTGVARAKDTYILIAAGADRVYGTEDDITSFGSVLP